jgi:anti-anti-sigma factor
MTGAMYFDWVPAAVEDGMTELVRGTEARFVERLAPVVRRRSLALDLGHVERIDAAGIAALITLYSEACKAGHRFSVKNLTPRVREILALVGLDRVLMTQDADVPARCGAEIELTAA